MTDERPGARLRRMIRHWPDDTTPCGDVQPGRVGRSGRRMTAPADATFTHGGATYTLEDTGVEYECAEYSFAVYDASGQRVAEFLGYDDVPRWVGDDEPCTLPLVLAAHAAATAMREMTPA